MSVEQDSTRLNDRGDSGRLSRRERERLRHRREILLAAERVFVRRGFHEATVEEIAQEADFAVGTLYNFFNGKEHLYTEVIRHVGDEFFAAFEERVACLADPAAALEALVELRLTIFLEHRGFYRAFFDLLPGSRRNTARAIPESCQPLYRRYVESVNALFARGIAAGLFVEEDPLCLTLCVDGIINAFIGHWSRPEAEAPAWDDLVAKIKRLCSRAVSPA